MTAGTVWGGARRRLSTEDLFGNGETRPQEKKIQREKMQDFLAADLGRLSCWKRSVSS
jgi:hypothetical protein